MKLTVFLFLFAIFLSFQTKAQDLTYEEKIEKMILLSGSKDQFEQIIINVLDVQREAFGFAPDNPFFEEFKAGALKDGYDDLMPQLIPVYKAHLTEQEVEGMIDFYSSEIGRSFVKKTPAIMQDLMAVGGKWGQALAQSVMDKLSESDILKFERIIEDDCTAFRTGTFESNNDGKDITIIRADGYQTEFYKGNSFEFKIEWEGNNRYLLKVMDASGKEVPTATLEVNIFEVMGSSYKYIARSIGKENYVEGTIHKVE